ncbi:MAG: dephospho-CoA kinase, partial [Candidatus Thermoplasmatota archaeon]|nr:dephospho-CoA kinase [Candidatus Thermoplasmatota archaeon]
MFIALTGTPGTGKTTIAGLLKEKGFTVIDIQKIAIDEDIIEGIDKKRDSIILDPARLNVLVTERYSSNDTIIFEGHISHLLSCMDKAIVLRCRPDILLKRL